MMDARITTEITAALADMYDTFGEPATYNAAGVVVIPRYPKTRSMGDPSVVLGQLEIRIRRSDVSRPVPGDAVTIDATSYVVAEEPSGSRMEWTLTLAEEAL